MTDQLSTSEKHGLDHIRSNDLQIYSVGISTAGVTEIYMARANPNRHIIATTIDTEGVASTKLLVRDAHLENQIEVRHENVAQALPYSDETFDFVYARLVLHYLSKTELTHALVELKRILKTGGRLFVVVRSDTCPSAVQNRSNYDPLTGFTTYISKSNKNKSGILRKRFFHSESSISTFIKRAGLHIDYVTSYEEKLFHDFNRTQPASQTDILIELTAIK